VHPHLSTVTYLTDAGAPTVVLPQRSSACGELPACELSTVVVSYPAVGKHLKVRAPLRAALSPY
jgi:DNA-binding transcriptional ArsR family regulator